MPEILIAPNAVLSQTTQEYDFNKGDKFLSSLLNGMEKALLLANDPKGVGLAAPQIGKSLRIFLAKPKEKSKITAFINPKVVEIEQNSHKPGARSKKQVKLEGCLSLPNIWGEVKRSSNVTISYQTADKKLHTKEFSGFMATIVQHEMDHLEGILFPRRVLEQKGKLYKSSKNKKGEDQFEELEI